MARAASFEKWVIPDLFYSHNEESFWGDLTA